MTSGARIPRVRGRPLPTDPEGIIVRGDDGGETTDRRQAEAFLRRFPDWERYGLSAFHAVEDADFDELAATVLERYPVLRIYRPGALRALSVEVVPTFRSPHVTLAFTDLEAGLTTLARSRHERRPNPYHEPVERGR